jgi:hypothetical protein
LAIKSIIRVEFYAIFKKRFHYSPQKTVSTVRESARIAAEPV